MFKTLRNHLIMGFIVLLPALATLYVLKVLFVFVDRILGNFLTGVLVALGFIHESEGKIHLLGFGFDERIPGIGFLLMILILIVVGLFAKGVAGKKAIRATERSFKRIPLARSVYSTVQQVITTFIQDRSTFKKVILVEYPRKGIYTMGFLTGEAQLDIQETTGTECVNVFLPTTPNPTSGWMVIVPKKDIIELDLTIEQGLKYIISGGVVVPRTPKYPLFKKDEQDLDQLFARLQMKTDLSPEIHMKPRVWGRRKTKDED